MKISRKLSLLAGTVIVGSLLIIGILVFTMAPLLTVQQEQKTLYRLETALSNLTISVLSLPQTTITIGQTDVQKKIDLASAAFENVTNLKALPAMNEDIAQALITISDLQKLQDDRVAALVATMNEIKVEVEAADAITFNIKVADLPTSSTITRKNLSDRFSDLITQYNRKSDILIDTMESIADTIIRQEEFISDETRRIMIRSSLISGIISLIIFAAALMVSVLISRRISRAVKVISSGVDRLEEGDLTARSVVKNRDELGHLGRSLGRFAGSLTESVLRIGRAADQSRKAQNNLSSATEEASAATSQMKANTESIRSQIEILDESVKDSSSAITAITAGIEETDREFAGQIAMVEESSAAITQMIASVQNVNRIAERSTAATTDLKAAASVGGDRLGETTQIISSVRESVDGIRDITGIIQGIASRTNLLAMNAAIEAAHAGEAGRGFSVVADEIRKLAEASAVNSKQISGILTEMIREIESADKAGQETREAFGNLDKRVNEVNESYEGIRSSMKELEVGGSEILNAMSELNEASGRAGVSSRKIKDQSVLVGKSVIRLEHVSGEVAGGVGEITVGLDGVNNIMEHLVDLSREISQIGDRLEKSVAVFKVESPTT